MTSEEKLKHFEESALGRANELSEEMHRQLQASYDQDSSVYQDTQNAQALQKVRTQIQFLKRDSNIALSKEQINIKREYTRRREELTEQLFMEVKEKLQQYKNTPAYLDLLKQQITGVQKAAKDKEYKIYVSPLDADKKEALEQELQISLELSEDSFLGGVKGLVDHGRILVDDSFDARLRDLRADFTFEGGTSHE